MAKGITVYSVLYHVSDDHPAAGGGPAGDGSFIFRSRSRKAADEFAKGKDYYSGPAEVQVDENVPRRIAERWGCA